MYHCTRCNLDKPEARFYVTPRVKKYRKEWCKECYSAYHKIHKKTYIENNREKIKQSTAAYRKTARYKETQHRGARTLKGKANSGRKTAKKRGLTWAISLEQHARLLSSGACHYCQGALPETGSGLDRKDNSVGYIESNCVPCCFTCNMLKSDLLSYDEMLAVSKLLKELRK